MMKTTLWLLPPHSLVILGFKSIRNELDLGLLQLRNRPQRIAFSEVTYRLSRVRMGHAYASLEKFSSTRARRWRISISRVRVGDACAWH
ncbi:uncharacterized protein DS421_9g269470 [Arachis hypogaea]|nr:uncharacterized protein DS421_9g269470 [Arachis hypogaea]